MPTPAWKPYTRTGDTGQTSLGDYTRVDKDNLRIAVYGDCEEASAILGLAVTLGGVLSNEMVRVITRVQNDLVDVAADVCAPVNGNDEGHLRIDGEYVARLERACDHFNAELTQPSNFVVAGGTTTAAALYYACSVTRRAERSAEKAIKALQEGEINPLARTYLNRLANLLLVLARSANEEHGDTPWEPGLTAHRNGLELWEPLVSDQD
ncbi:cob(I)yrinic acid a,c-diamide adenosyltransferase [Spelaeicoccus albus]